MYFQFYLKEVTIYELNNDVMLKSKELINNNIVPIICIGETLNDKNEQDIEELLYMCKCIIQELPNTLQSGSALDFLDLQNLNELLGAGRLG